VSDLTDAILAGDIVKARVLMRERPELLKERSATGTLPRDLARRKGISELEAALLVAGAPSDVPSCSPDDLLLSVLYELSDSHAAAGWLGELEFLVWAGVIGDVAVEDPYNLSRLPHELASDLQALARRAGGWPAWHEPDGPTLVTMETWLHQYEAWRRERVVQQMR
jgi:hypothetical protein